MRGWWWTVLAACGGPDDEAKPSPVPPEPTTATPAPVPEEASAAESPLRRLSASQYRNTVVDLFPGIDLPGLPIAADAEVFGFDNNADAQVPSALLIEQYQAAALISTEAALARPEGWLPCPADGGTDPSSCGRDAIAAFLEPAFRRPVTASEVAAVQALFDEVFAAEGDFSAALQVALQAVLNSPEFLYFPEFGLEGGGDGVRIPLTGHELATRLAYFAWDGPPDAALRAAAADGTLDDPSGVAAEMERLLNDPKALRAVDNFHRLWLDLEEIQTAIPDPATYPDWDPGFVPLLEREAADFARYASWQGPGTLDALLLDTTSFADPSLAPLYGDPIALDPTQRAGTLTRAGFLTATSHAVYASPVQRGKFVLDRFLCAPPPPPPPTVNTELAEGTGSEPLTNRERYSQHSADPLCASCHVAIDGVGFGFENYDAIGRFRTEDNGFPVDASGVLVNGDLADTPYEGALELSALLAGSETVHRCAVVQWWRYANGRTEDPVEDAATVAELTAGFVATGGRFRDLLVAIANTETFRTRRAP